MHSTLSYCLGCVPASNGKTAASRALDDLNALGESLLKQSLSEGNCLIQSARWALGPSNQSCQLPGDANPPLNWTKANNLTLLMRWLMIQVVWCKDHIFINFIFEQCFFFLGWGRGFWTLRVVIKRFNFFSNDGILKSVWDKVMTRSDPKFSDDFTYKSWFAFRCIHEEVRKKKVKFVTPPKHRRNAYVQFWTTEQYCTGYDLLSVSNKSEMERVEKYFKFGSFTCPMSHFPWLCDER